MELDLDLKNELNNIDLFNEEIKCASDRSCAIVCAAILDNSLQNILLSYLTEDSKTQNNNLFSQNGPLATFSSKIILSYRLGLISKYEHDKLNLIRKIRNYFAHDLSINKFECSCCKELLSQNIPDENLFPPLNIPISYKDNGSPTTLPIEMVFDMDRYKTILPKFPALEYPILDRNSMRSIFICIVFILQASLTSRRFKAIIEKRKIADDFNSIIDIEKYKIDSFENKIKEDTDRLTTLKEEILLKIADAERHSHSLENENLYKLKDLHKTRQKIDSLIQESESYLQNNPEYALLLHTYKIIEHSKS